MAVNLMYVGNIWYESLTLWQTFGTYSVNCKIMLISFISIKKLLLSIYSLNLGFNWYQTSK